MSVVAPSIVDYARAIPAVGFWLATDARGNIAWYAEDVVPREVLDAELGHGIIGPQITIENLGPKNGKQLFRETFDVRVYFPRSYASSIAGLVVLNAFVGGIHRQPSAVADYGGYSVLGVDAPQGGRFSDDEYWFGRVTTVTLLLERS